MGAGATEDARIALSAAHRSEIQSVVAVIEALGGVDASHAGLKRRIVKDLLWVVTEYRPSYRHKIEGVAWRTPEADALVSARRKGIRHEHVVERDWLARLLVDRPDLAESAVWECPCALVTVDEHTALDRTGEWGWRRYIAAGLRIIDARTGERADLAAMAESLEQRYAEIGATPRQL